MRTPIASGQETSIDEASLVVVCASTPQWCHTGHALRKCMQPVAPKLTCTPWVEEEQRRWPCVSSFSMLVCPLPPPVLRGDATAALGIVKRRDLAKLKHLEVRALAIQDWTATTRLCTAKVHTVLKPGRPPHQARHESILSTFGITLGTPCKKLTSVASASDPPRQWHVES